jgi:hypothetical protein
LTAIILACRQCGTETENLPGAFGPDGRCSECYVRDILTPYGVEMTRLWNKYNHYSARGINLTSLNHQTRNKFARAQKKALDAVPGANPTWVAELCIKVLITEAQSQAAGFSRILRSDARI